MADYLEPMGYEVTAAHDGITGLEMIRSGDYDAVILDVMMPRMDGFEVLKQLRLETDIPVLMLTARGDETDRIVGLEMGADDYIPKTFSSRELLARLRAVSRRCSRGEPPASAEGPAKMLRCGELTINPNDRTVRLGIESLTLTPVEYDLLALMAGSCGRVFSRDQLLDAVAGRSYDVLDRSVDVHISSLRRKLGDDPRRPRYIHTVRSVGYMLKHPENPAS